MNHFAQSFIGVVLVLSSSPTFAVCLDEAAAFAKQICGEVSNRGSSRLVTASGELNAEAKGLIRQLLGSAGGELKGETDFSSYENVLHEQLGSELVNVRECGVRMAEAAIKQVCAKPVTYRTCRHPDFGQAGWASEETLQGTSGWRGGGYNQGAYCSNFIASVISSHGLGGTPYQVDRINSSEEGRWTGTFGRDRQYNYHCVVKLHWGPIYNERADERCGVLN